MIRVRFAIPLLAGVALAVYSCSGPSSRSRAASLVTAPSFNKTSTTCDASTLLSLARSYFSSPQQQATTDTLRAMQDECNAGDSASVVTGGWSILSTIDTISAAGTGGSGADGASLANGVMNYMSQDGIAPGLKAPDTLEHSGVAPVTAADLGSEGIFSVRGADTTTVVAHGSVPFTFGGPANEALWGVQLGGTATWKSITGAPTILIYGEPDTLPDVKDATIGNLAFQLHTFPNVSGFTEDGVLQVGVCYEYRIALSGNANVLQRNGTLLQTDSMRFCGQLTNQSPQIAMTSFHGVLDGLLAMAGRAFLPQPLLAATTNPPSTGGSPIDFSDFAPVAANPAGTLQYVTPPVDGVDSVQLDSFTVAALSGGGTQIERVPIQLYLSTNNGVPAGASFCNTDGSGCSDTTATTVEGGNGYGTVATFDSVTIYKPGGYLLCAKATSVVDEQGNSITFQPVCATIHIKNN